jgi:hypothetical protein
LNRTKTKYFLERVGSSSPQVSPKSDHFMPIWKHPIPEGLNSNSPRWNLGSDGMLGTKPWKGLNLNLSDLLPFGHEPQFGQRKSYLLKWSLRNFQLSS